MDSEARAYPWIGRVFRVERVGTTGVWCAIGRGAGQPAYPLSRIGGETDREAMQHKLDAWARRYGLHPIAKKPVVEKQMTLGV